MKCANNKYCILFETGMKGMGVTFHLSLLALELKKIIPNFYALHDNTEQEEGLISKLSSSGIEQFNYTQSSIEEILLELKKKGHTRIIFHAESWGGIRRVSPYKKPFNITIINGVNAYRNGKWYRSLVAKYVKLRYDRSIDHWVFFSQKAKEQFCHYANVSEKSWVIPWGIEYIENLSKQSHYIDIYFQDKEQYNKSTYYIFYAAQFYKNKSHEELIKTLAPILKNQNAKLMLCGDGNLMNKTLVLTEKLKIRANVCFLGRIKRSTFLEHLANANLSIVLSKNETFGHTIIEPLQLGVPVISTAVGIAPEAIFDFQNGFCINLNEKEKIRSIVHSLITGTIKLESNYNTQYSWKNTAQLYHNLYKFSTPIK